MAEGSIVDGVLGEDASGSESGRAQTGVDPVAVALCMKSEKHDPEFNRAAKTYLDTQRRLLDLQIGAFPEEHRLSVAAAKRKRFSDISRNIVAGSVATLTAWLVLLVVWAGYDAARDRSLIVDVFSVPPDYLAQGLSGNVVSEQLLDGLSDLSASDVSARPASSYTNAPVEDAKVEIPSTGLSFGELRRVLREVFGSNSHITGAIYRKGAQVTVSVRVGEGAAASFTGDQNNSGDLLRRAVEFVFGQTQPYRYARYLAAHGRASESRPILERLVHDRDPLERAWAHLAIGASFGDQSSDYFTDALEQRRALAEVPALIPAMNNLIRAEITLGHDEAVFNVANQCLSHGWEIKKYVAPAWHKQSIANCAVHRSLMQGDFGAVISSGSVSTPDPVYADFAPLWLALGQLYSHDLDGALITAHKFPKAGKTSRDMIEAFVALERHDRYSVQLWDARVAKVDDASVPAAHDAALRLDVPYLALAKARFAEVSEAQQLIYQTPMDCYRCARIKAQIAAIANQSIESERWFADAISQAPELPQAFVDRGQARLEWGNIQGAFSDASTSVRLGPRDPDGWKLLGDVLLKQGKREQARKHYEQAIALAPKWLELKDALASVM